MPSAAEALQGSIEAAIGAKIVGVSIGRRDDKTTWRAQYAKPLTRAQQAAADRAIAAFDAMIERPDSNPIVDLVKSLIAAKVLNADALPASVKAMLG